MQVQFQLIFVNETIYFYYLVGSEAVSGATPSEGYKPLRLWLQHSNVTLETTQSSFLVWVVGLLALSNESEGTAD